MVQENFITYRNFKWLWFTLIALLLCTVVYIVDTPVGGPNGGTTGGYTFGIISTIGVIWLMAYGIRKRAYGSSLGTVEGWLAAHVWIGIGLLLLVPLHAGFSFGVNVHTLAYVSMVLTIVSGIWGAANYAVLSGRITAHRGGVKDLALIEQIGALNEQIEGLCVQKSEQFLALLNRFDLPFKVGLRALLKLTKLPVFDQQIVAALLTEIPESERNDAVGMLGMLDYKRSILSGLIEQARIKALLKIWLYVHVPVSVVLCVALAVHIFAVFFLR